MRRPRLTAIVDSTIRTVLGRATFIDVIRTKRAELMRQTKALVNDEMQNFGVEMVDVRIRRADLPEANSQAIYKRMRTEREREAAELRAQGSEQSQRIKSTADKDVTVLVANANREVRADPRRRRRGTQPASTRKPSARIKTSSPSTGRCKPTTKR